MTRLTHLQSLWSRDMPALGQVARIGTDTGGATPVLRIHDPAGRTLSEAPLTVFSLLSPRGFSSQRANGTGREIDIGGQGRDLDAGTIDWLRDQPGSALLHLDGVAFHGNLMALHMVELPGGSDILYGARVTGSGVQAWNVWSGGGTAPRDFEPATDGNYLQQVGALDSLRVGGQTWLLAASQAEHGLTAFRILSDGRLLQSDAFGYEERLPLAVPTMLATVEAGQRGFVLVAAQGSGSLTVLELDGAGRLRFVDQVNDNLITRFGGAAALDVHSQNGQTLVAVAGNDGGVSLFQMLPDGRLMLRDTLVDVAASALSGISQLEFVQVGSRLELIALAPGEGGLARMVVEGFNPGIVTTGGNGGGRDDVLIATAAGGTRRGGAGDDVLIDAAGRDTLWGDAGADVFIFRPDRQEDRIQDFNPAEDRIDLSAYPMLADPAEIQFSALAGGVRLRFQQDELRIYSQDGRSLDRGDISHALLFAEDRVTMPPPLPNRGTRADETFEASPQPDTIDGGGGYDVVTFEQAPLSATVSLANSGANAGAAAGYVLSAIEGITGTQYGDRLVGDGLGNRLTGLAGNDVIEGGAGADWITPGPGHDTIDGGTGTDMVSFVDMDQAVIANLEAGTVRSGPHTNVLRNVENLTGSVYGDFIQGNGNANQIRGLGDYDWIVGSWGADTIDGGTGRDMVSYVHSPYRVVVDLGAGTGQEGHARGDRYTSIERVTGSVHADLFYGSDGEDDFRGLGGYDWFNGSGGGRDRYDGGSGSDMVSYAASPSGVAASLLLGRGTRGDAARDLYTSIERLTGSNFDDVLTGDNGRNELRGMFGADLIFGNGGVDYITGGGRDDTIDGGSGFDYALFSGDRDEYRVYTAGRATIVDRIASGGDGNDTLYNIEALIFADGIVYL